VAFGTQDDTDEVMNEINMTPLVDVMLVLLIIFIITVPVMKHAVNIDLPRASAQPQDTKPETVPVRRRAGQLFLERAPGARRRTGPAAEGGGGAHPQPELHIRGDKAVRYERWRKAMAAAQQAGLRKIGFITEAARSTP
jgi:biopolymer transport protein ExbD